MTAGSLQSLRARCTGIALGVFAADAGRLRSVAENVAEWGGKALHFDVMDGVFVPAITGGPAFIAALDVGLVRDVHLMVHEPSRHVAAFADAGADLITIHAEAEDVVEAVAEIRAAAERLRRPVLAGLGLMPGTAPEAVEPLLAREPDLILVLSVDPRHKASPDIGLACDKLRALRAHPWKIRPLLAFDGGVTTASIDEIAACEPDLVISGGAVFAASEPRAAFKRLNTAFVRTWPAVAVAGGEP